MNTNATRKIKFRALHDKRFATDDEWIYGTPYFSEDQNEWYMFIGNAIRNKDNIVKGETIGQYVDYCDENGTEIYEGDVVKCYSAERQSQGLMVVDFIGGAFRFVQLGEYLGIYPPQKLQITYPLWRFQKEVVGNIHTTPEFQKVRQIVKW